MWIIVKLLWHCVDESKSKFQSLFESIKWWVLCWFLSWPTESFSYSRSYQLLRKLERYGIRCVAYSWLENGQQCVQMNKTVSESRKGQCGVTQGSLIDPKLFILFIHDICNISKLIKCVVYTDDTNLFCSGKTLTGSLVCNWKWAGNCSDVVWYQ